MTTVFLCFNFKNLTFSAPNKINVFEKNIAYKFQYLMVYGVELFYVTKCVLQKANVLSGIHLNRWKYNVCRIKLKGIYFVIYGIISEFTDKGQFQYLTN